MIAASRVRVQLARIFEFFDQQVQIKLICSFSQEPCAALGTDEEPVTN